MRGKFHVALSPQPSALIPHLLALLLLLLPVTLSGIDTGRSVLELLIALSHRDLLLSPPGRREEPGGPSGYIHCRLGGVWPQESQIPKQQFSSSAFSESEESSLLKVNIFFSNSFPGGEKFILQTVLIKERLEFKIATIKSESGVVMWCSGIAV